MSGLLSGLKILDFTTLLPGPFGTMVLADMGADIIHIEALNRLDMIRGFPPVVDGISAIHEHINRNKKSIALNLKKSEAIEIVKMMISEYDILIEQFRPGVMKRLGIDYETLKQINPEIIYCSLTAYGQKGPYSQRAGHDINFLALSGIASYSGSKNNGPNLFGLQIGDISGSLHVVIGILGAVINRNNTGKGQYIDISMLDTVLSLSPINNVNWLTSGHIPDYEDGILNGGGFYNYYRTKDNRFLSIGSLEPKFFYELIKGLDTPEIQSDDPMSNKTIPDIIQRKIQERTLAGWIKIFNDLDACVEPVLNLKEVENHPQIKSRQIFFELKLKGKRGRRQVAHPIKYSNFQPEYKFPGSKLGEHTQEILEKFGVTPSQIKDLKNKEVTN